MSDTLTPGSPPVAGNGQPVGGAASPPPLTDQERFDAAVNRDGKIFLQVLGGCAILAAVVMSLIALLVSTGKSNTSTVTVTQPAVAAASAPASTSSGPLITLSVASENKKGSDGKMHDSYSKTNFAVKVGQPTRLRIDNTDSGSHSITSAETGVNIIVMPGVHTYTILAKKAGRFEWKCDITCDTGAAGWAMTHPGYMAGYITAT
jgi:plastocyanin